MALGGVLNPPSHRTEIAFVRTAAFVQGLTLVVIPTVSTVLMNANGLALSEASYGALFLPQSILAVVFSLAGAGLIRRLGAQPTLIIGFAANAVAMGLIASTALLTLDRNVAYIVLFCGTSFLGMGFAIVTPTLNDLAGALEVRKADRAVLVVNALLGGSAAVAPLLLILFVGIGWWWGLPLLCALGMLVLAIVGLSVPLRLSGDTRTHESGRLPARLWLFAAFAFVYGLCEQLNGSWAPVYVSHHLGAAPAYGSLALALFWATATGARVVFAVKSAHIKPAIVFRILPFVLALAFVVLALLPAKAPALLGVAAFAFAGLGVSALLPLVISLGASNMRDVATTATSIVFATYLVGYGIAAFGVGPLQQRGISLPTLDAYAVGLALIVAVLSIVTVRTVGERA